jgi:KDO2-lipid IV(A) lauroyltransferase
MWLVRQGIPMTVVVEALEPPELFEWFVGFRRSLGMHVVPLGPGAGAAVLRALHDGHVVCLLSDRTVGGSPGVPVTFFGEATSLPAGAATVALRTGAPIHPTAVYFLGRRDGHLGLVGPPLDTARSGARIRDDVQRVTQLLARELEILIRRAPTQWHLMQPNWPSDPGYEEKSMY